MSYDEQDPFGSVQTAPDVPSNDPWQETAPAVTNTPQRPDPVPSEGKVVVTLKGGPQHGAPWVVIHADDADDALKQLDNTMAELLKKSANVSRFFHEQVTIGGGQPQAGHGGGSQSANQGNGGSYQRQQSNGQAGRPDNANQAPSGQPEFCRHGEMIFRSGFNEQKQKSWSGYFCPEPKGSSDQCKPKFGK